MSATMTVLDRIIAMLDEASVSYQLMEHEPTYTSEDAARVRGEPLEIGGKAIVLNIGDGQFALFVMSAARKLHSASVRRVLRIGKHRFATREELHELTGLMPGCIPPFGEPILSLPLYVDESVFENDRIAFNAGSLTHSLVMSIEDYRRVAQIESVVRVTQPPTSDG